MKANVYSLIESGRIKVTATYLSLYIQSFKIAGAERGEEMKENIKEDKVTRRGFGRT